MTLSLPDLTIIIPTFRREALLLEALQSALAVPGLALEVLVIDDSPEGGAQAVVRALGDARVQYLQQVPPSGGRPAVLRNRGLSWPAGAGCISWTTTITPFRRPWRKPAGALMGRLAGWRSVCPGPLGRCRPGLKRSVAISKGPRVFWPVTPPVGW